MCDNTANQSLRIYLPTKTDLFFIPQIKQTKEQKDFHSMDLEKQQRSIWRFQVNGSQETIIVHIYY